MIFGVVWVPTAQNDLASIWLAAADPDAVTRASHQIDVILAWDADHQGRAFADTRILVVPPLLAVFDAYPDDAIAVVLELQELGS